MPYSPDDLKQLVRSPKESYELELKRWLDPEKVEGIAKIAKACLALRNNNGGCLVIGFEDDGTPDESGPVAPKGLDAFHIDVIQQIVSKFAAEPFAVRVEMVERDGKQYPVIVVPSGVETPVCAKADLLSESDPKSKPLIKVDAVYVRSITANNTVSSTEARRQDWPRLIRICFDNREADIGSFIRRHLSGVEPSTLLNAVSELSEIGSNQSGVERARGLLDHGRTRFDTITEERQLELPKSGYVEAAAVLEGEIPECVATESFLNRLLVLKPQHSGWTPWADLRRGEDDPTEPFVYDGAWEAYIAVSLGPAIDYWSIHPGGRFYHIRALKDDLVTSDNRPKPGTELDFSSQASWVAEVMSTALSFGKSMGCAEENTNLAFVVRWSGLDGRFLTSWAVPNRTYHSRGKAKQDEITTDTVVPLDASMVALRDHVRKLVSPLYTLFGGAEFQASVIDGIVDETLQSNY